MNHSEAPISITVKTPHGSLVTVRANNGEELDEVVSNAFAAITSATTELEAAVRGVAPTPVTQEPAPSMSVAQVAQSFGAHIVEAPTSAPATSIPSIGGRACAHGKMTAIQGTGKDGRIYRGYFCPAPKGALDKCKNQYVVSGSPEWSTFVPEQVK
jgi:hypothetical protein